MKNQYFGDINDYHKYGLIRQLTGSGRIRTAVCWMLTPNISKYNERRSKYKYLSRPDKWRHFDFRLYDQLSDLVIGKNIREVRAVESAGILPNCRFHSSILPDNARKRCLYFQAFSSKVSPECDLVFFDPDTGLEVGSTPYGQKGSSKYLYWREVVRFFALGHSLLIYQHFPRVQRDRFIAQIARELAGHTCVPKVYSFRTPNVVFLLVPQTAHRKFFQEKIQVVRSVWREKIRCQGHAIA